VTARKLDSPIIDKVPAQLWVYSPKNEYSQNAVFVPRSENRWSSNRPFQTIVWNRGLCCGTVEPKRPDIVPKLRHATIGAAQLATPVIAAIGGVLFQGESLTWRLALDFEHVALRDQRPNHEIRKRLPSNRAAGTTQHAESGAVRMIQQYRFRCLAERGAHVEARVV
jgi:hypothetical protein